MEERIMAYIIWAILGVFFIAMGIYDINSKKEKPFGFWANADVAPIEDVKGYNRALGILVRIWYCVYVNRIAFIRWSECGTAHYSYIRGGVFKHRSYGGVCSRY